MPGDTIISKTPLSQASPSLSKSPVKVGKFDWVRTLGEGKFTVELVVDPETNKKYACKIFNSKFPVAKFLCLREKEVATIIESNHTVRFIEHLEDCTYVNSYGDTITSNIVISEYADHGDFFDFVGVGHFEEEIARVAFKQIVDGLGSMHGKGWAHLDLKLENIFVAEDFTLKIGDYDLCRAIDGKSVDGMVGTVNIRSPEMFETLRFNPVKADIFALGVILFCMCFGYPPFMKATPFDPFYKQIKAKAYETFWQKHEDIAKGKKLNLQISKELKELVGKLLAYEEKERPSIEEIKESLWLKREKYDEESYVEEMKRRLMRKA